MKVHHTPIIHLAITLLASCFAAVSSAQGPVQPITAKVIYVHGDARYGTTANDWRPLRAGDVLNEGATVQTGKKQNSFLDLAIGEGQDALIRLWADTALKLDQLISRGPGSERTTEVRLDLPAGRITGKIGKLAAESKVEIKLPVELIGIRPPSLFEVLSDGSASVASGTVVIVRTDQNAASAVVVTPDKRYDAKSETVVALSASERKELNKSLTVPERQAPPRTPQTGLAEPRPQRKF